MNHKNELSEAKQALLAKRIQGKLGNLAEEQTIPRRSASALAPLSFAQQRLWFLHQLTPQTAAYNISCAIKIEGPLDRAALEQSFNQVIQRHEILRTRFASQADQPEQIIEPAVSLSLPVLNLTDLPSAQKRQAEADRIIEAEIQRPFDLTRLPLLRVNLLRLGQTEHLLLLIVHHIIFDEWSMSILSEEIMQLYRAFSRGVPSSLDPLPFQYADFAHWQRRQLQGETLQTQLEYWTEQLGDDPPALALPHDQPRPKKLSDRGATQTLLLPDPLATALKTFSQRQGVTLFMTLLAAFQTLLYRYTGQDDLLIGTPIANRTQAQTKALIGLFVNTLVLRTDLSGHPTFLELVKRVQRVALEAYAHQDLPFEVLVDELNPIRDLSRHPLFQVMFVFRYFKEDLLEAPALTFTPMPMPVENRTAKFDLTLFVEEREQSLIAALEYSTDLFEPATIDRTLGHFQTLLTSVMANPHQPLFALPLLTQSEQHQLLVTWNDTQADYPADQCFHHLFEAQVERTPEAVAVAGPGRQLTYQQLNQRANQLAHYLRSLGVGPEQLVGIFVERSVEMMVGLLGILKAGAAYVPLDPINPPDRLGLILNDAQVSVLLTQRHLLARLPQVETPVVCLDAVRQRIAATAAENPVKITTADNLAYVIYTSGSTGQPKGVAVPHRGLVNYLTWAVRAYPLEAGWGAPVHTSISFDLTITALFGPLLTGRPVHVLAVNTGVMGVNTLSTALQGNSEFSLIKLTPAHLELLSRQLTPQEAAGRTRAFIIGGENLLAENIAFWQQTAPDTHLINEYGPTETVVGCCVYQVPAGKLQSGSVPIGRPIANTQIYLLDPQLQPVPIGVPGEIHIGGAGIARGYLNRPALTAEKFIPNPFSAQPGARLYKTGDLAHYLPDGNLEFLGRIDKQVKIRGFRIELGEIETVLRRHPAIQEAAVVAREDSAGGRQLIVYLVSASSQPPRPETVRRFVEQKLPDYMIPTSFIFVDALPLSPGGKLDHRRLPEPNRQYLPGYQRFAAPTDALERQLVQIWESILNIQPVGVNDNFFELGGHSLLAVRVFAQIENRLHKTLPVATLFQAPTVARLARVIRQEETPALSSLVEIQPQGSRPPFFCVHGMGGGVLDYADLARYLGLDQPFYGLQEPALKEKHHSLFATIQEMAAYYIQEMQTVQPKGPYYVGGYCYGGTVAYEMACQLQTLGEQAALVAIMDNSPPNITHQETAGSLKFWLKFLKNLPYWLHDFFQLSPEQMTARLRRKLRIIKQRGINHHSPSTQPSQADIEAIADIDLSQIPQRHHQLLEAHYRAMAVYKPEPYQGPVTLFKTQRYPLFGPFDPQMGWGNLALGGLEIKEIKGFHANILQEPYVQLLAQQLRHSLDQAQENAANR